MSTQSTFPYTGAIDADGHILEPPDIWEQYIDLQYSTVPVGIHLADEPPSKRVH